MSVVNINALRAFGPPAAGTASASRDDDLRARANVRSKVVPPAHGLELGRGGRISLPLRVPPPALCIDNGAMIGAVAFYSLRYRPDHVPTLVRSSMPLPG